MLKRLVLLVALLTGLSAFSQTITYLPAAPIASFDAAYGQDAVRIAQNIPIQNPDHCPAADGTYATDPSLPGSKLQQATLLAAFLAGKQVALAISGCAPLGMPRIDNVHVLP